MDSNVIDDAVFTVTWVGNKDVIMYGMVDSTSSGGEGQGFNFDRWAAKNELNDTVKSLFQKHGATSPDKMTFTSPQIHALMAEMGQSQPHMIGVVMSAINDIGTISIKKIVITEEELQVIESITQNLKGLDDTQQHWTELRKSYPQSVARIKQEKLKQIENSRVKIKETFDTLCDRIQRRKQGILKEIEKIQSNVNSMDDDDEKKGMDDETSLINLCASTLRKTTKYLKGQRKQYEDLTSTNEDRLNRKRNVIDLGEETQTEFTECKQELDRDMAIIKKEIENNNNSVIDMKFVPNAEDTHFISDGICTLISVTNEVYGQQHTLFKKAVDDIFCAFSPKIQWKRKYSESEIESARTQLKRWRSLDLPLILQSLRNLSAFSQQSDAMDTLQNMSDSKICSLIWRNLIGDNKSTSPRTLLRRMGTYELVKWIRELNPRFQSVAKGFDIEILVQIVYDKELNGRQLDQNEIQKETLQTWFAECNKQQKGSDKVPQQMIEGVIDVFLRELDQKEMNRRKESEHKQHSEDTESLKDSIILLVEHWDAVKRQFALNKMTVQFIQTHCSFLKSESTSNIQRELEIMFRGRDQAHDVYLENISQSIAKAFQCLTALESAKCLRGCTQFLHQLLWEKLDEQNRIIDWDEDDQAWKQWLRMLNTDCSQFSLNTLQEFCSRNKLDRDCGLVARQWMVMIASNRKCIRELYSRFHDDKAFEEHMVRLQTQ